jgi:cytochrome c-type biogenesis protein CcmH
MFVTALAVRDSPWKRNLAFLTKPMKYTLAALPLRLSPSQDFVFRLAILAAVTFLSFAAVQTARAQDATATPLEEASTPAAATDGGAAAPAAAAAGTASADQIDAVAKQLWCPLCSGVRLDACELKACSQMKEVIGEKLAQGVDVQTIKNYFVAQYGPQVLGEPPMEGFNWLAWVLPVVALIAGGIFVYSRTRKMVRTAPTAAAAQDAVAPGQGAAGDDEYAQKLDEELKHYD